MLVVRRPNHVCEEVASVDTGIRMDRNTILLVILLVPAALTKQAHGADSFVLRERNRLEFGRSVHEMEAQKHHHSKEGSFYSSLVLSAPHLSWSQKNLLVIIPNNEEELMVLHCHFNVT